VEASVTRVVDGDTIVVALDDLRGSRVRLIGIDTPERDDCMYRAATDRMRSLVEGKRVRLAKDVSETDRYGRLLRYVYVGEVFVNAAMVIEGFAAAATFPPDVAHAAELASFERDARGLRRGLWSGTCVP
jgi:micrococcal nuclease